MIVVMRLGHRIHRDERATTHVCLVARAFGADKVFVSGDKDDGVISSVIGVSEQWGGLFGCEYVTDCKKTIEKMKKTHKVVHLTMYWVGVQDKIREIKKHENICVVVGSQKVPPWVFQIADYNIAITNQPHSEVAALAVFLDRYFDGFELEKSFEGKRKIKPNERGKSVVLCDELKSI